MQCGQHKTLSKLQLHRSHSYTDSTFLHFLSTNCINEYWIGCVFHPSIDPYDCTVQSVHQKWLKMECYVVAIGKWLPMSEGIVASSYLVTQLHSSLTDVIQTVT